MAKEMEPAAAEETQAPAQQQQPQQMMQVEVDDAHVTASYANFCRVTGSPEALENVKRAVASIRALNDIAQRRGQSLAQLALAWTLRDPRVTSTLIGASSVAQLEDNVGAIARLEFEDDELAEIDRYAEESGINIWERSSSA